MYSPDDEKIRNVAAAVFWLAIVQTVLLIISAAVGSFWIILVLIILLICGFIGAWKYNRGLVIAFMVYQGLIVIFCIVAMSLRPEAGIIVGSIITIIFAGVVFGISLWLVKLLQDKTEQERNSNEHHVRAFLLTIASVQGTKDRNHCGCNLAATE